MFPGALYSRPVIPGRRPSGHFDPVNEHCRVVEVCRDFFNRTVVLRQVFTHRGYARAGFVLIYGGGNFSSRTARRCYVIERFVEI